jgi:hypothetical protein
VFNSGFNESSVQPISLPPSPARGSLNDAALSELQDDEDEVDISDDSSSEDWDEDDDSSHDAEDEHSLDAEESDIDATTADSHQHGQASSSASVVSSSEDDDDERTEEREGEAERDGDGETEAGKQDGGSPGRRRTESELGSSAPFVDAPSAPASPSRTPVSRKSGVAEADDEPVAAPLTRDDKTSCAPLPKKKAAEQPTRPMFEVVVTDAACVLFPARRARQG